MRKESYNRLVERVAALADDNAKLRAEVSGFESVYKTQTAEIERWRAENDRLRAALSNLISVADEAHALLDADKDHKCLKLLIAMAGGLEGYRADVDAIHAALTPAKEDKP